MPEREQGWEHDFTTLLIERNPAFTKKDIAACRSVAYVGVSVQGRASFAEISAAAFDSVVLLTAWVLRNRNIMQIGRVALVQDSIVRKRACVEVSW